MDYPVLDDQMYSDTEQEIIDEHWQSYGRHDAGIALAKALNVDDVTEHALAILDEITFMGGNYGITDNYPMFIDASYVDFHTDDVVAWIVDNVGTVAEYGYPPFGNWEGTKRKVDLTLGTLVAS
jgi:hypothetical protein